MSFLFNYFSSNKSSTEPEKPKQHIEEEWVVVPEPKVQEQTVIVPDVTFLPTLVDIHNSLLSNNSEQEAEVSQESTIEQQEPIVQTSVEDTRVEVLPQVVARVNTTDNVLRQVQQEMRAISQPQFLPKPVVKKQQDRLTKLSNYVKPVKSQKMKMIRPLTNARGSKYASKRPYQTAF